MMRVKINNYNYNYNYYFQKRHLTEEFVKVLDAFFEMSVKELDGLGEAVSDGGQELDICLHVAQGVLSQVLADDGNLKTRFKY